ncbi:MAG: peptide deformylase [Alistipes sp.]|nr:peptide deformylase [Alistipes sp.]MBQ5875215.1 peptide deformylase [Alistipes sp.]
MKRLILQIFAMTLLMSCSSEFTSAEREIIYSGESEIMRVMSIANEQDSLLLRTPSKPLNKKLLQQDEFQTLCFRMLATVQNPENEGVGIAAPQVGILRRLVAVQRFDKEGKPFEFFINPEIVDKDSTLVAGGEGCLSVPEIYEDVERSQRITLRYYDADFVQHEEVIEGFTAVIFQHEIDHLDGKLFIDYLQ